MIDFSWLQGLKPGDKVLISRYGYIKETLSLGTVQKIGKQYATVNNMRFRLKDGILVGDAGSYHPLRLKPTTKEALETIHREKLIQMIHHKAETLVKYTKEAKTIGRLQRINETLHDLVISVVGIEEWEGDTHAENP